MAVDHSGLHFTKTLHADTYAAIDPRKRDLTGKYVFVTGASKGIGRETALSYARAGAAGIGVGARSDLAALTADIAAAAKAAGRATAPQVVAVPLDVTEAESVAAAARAVEAAFPRLDILVNNAGYLESRRGIVDSDPDEWWKTWTVNVQGPYLVSRAFLPLLLRGGDKTIVNLSSIAAHRIAPGGSAYQTSKLAVTRFTEFLDVEHGAASDGLLAFSVHPGGVLTDMGKRMPAAYHPALTETPQLAADVIVFLTETRRPWLAARYLSATWDVEELLAREAEIVAGDKLKVRMVV